MNQLSLKLLLLCQIILFSATFCQKTPLHEPSDVQITGPIDLSQFQQKSLNLLDAPFDNTANIAGTNEAAVQARATGLDSPAMSNEDGGCSNSGAQPCQNNPELPFTGQVNGLAGEGLVVQLHYAEATTEHAQTEFITVNGSGNSVTYFENPVSPEILRAEIVGQPSSPEQYCEIKPSNENAGVTPASVQIDCSDQIYLLAGYAAGQTGTVTLANKTDPQHIARATIQSGDQTFQFDRRFSRGEIFSIEVVSQPEGQTCYLPNGNGSIRSSDRLDLSLICKPTKYIGGTVSFGDAPSEENYGDLHFWFYHQKEYYYHPVYRYAISAPQGKLADFPFEFPVSAGTYYVRIFRDKNNDGLPTVGSDPQSASAGPVVAEDRNVEDLQINLIDTTYLDRYLNLNAYMYNEPLWRPYGGGVCGGLYLRLEAGDVWGDANFLSGPMAQIPDFGIYYLYDDGGCGDGQGNMDQSFDQSKDDLNYSYGISDESYLYAGEYLFFYQNTKYDVIHFYRDEISVLQALDPMIIPNKPDTSQAVPVLNPEIRWNPIAGALSYEVELTGHQGLYTNRDDPWRFTNTAYYYPEGRYTLADDQSYMVRLFAYDTDRTLQTDFDAASRGPEFFFITDTDGANSITLSGTITNRFQPEAGVILYGSGDAVGGWQGSLFLEPGINEYELAVLYGNTSDAIVMAALNLDLTGQMYSFDNYSTRKWAVASPGESANNLEVNLSWPVNPALVAPYESESGVGFSPRFIWRDYSSNMSSGVTFNAPVAWSQVIWIRNTAKPGFPEIAYGLPNGVSSFDPAMTGYQIYDIAHAHHCMAANGVWNDDNNTCSIPVTGSLNKLNDAGPWSWSVMIVDCDYRDHELHLDSDENGFDDYTDCVLDTIQGKRPAYAEAPPSVFAP